MQVRALVTLAALAVFAAVPAQAQIVVNTAAGVQQKDGSYLWEYEVTSGKRPAISHWVLGVCEQVFQSILPGSVTGSTDFVWMAKDPTTGASGIKFDEGYCDNETRTIGFRVGQDFGSREGTVAIKSGTQVKTQTVTMAKCPTNQVPEPGTLALALVGLVPLARRRRRS